MSQPAPPPPPKPVTSFVKQGIRRITTAPAKQGRLTQQTCSSYRLRWENLKAFLEKRYPKDKYPTLEFIERKITDDHYVFMAPEALTSDDRDQIALLLDKNPHAEQEREQSPEC